MINSIKIKQLYKRVDKKLVKIDPNSIKSEDDISGLILKTTNKRLFKIKELIV